MRRPDRFCIPCNATIPGDQVEAHFPCGSPRRPELRLQEASALRPAPCRGCGARPDDPADAWRCGPCYAAFSRARATREGYPPDDTDGEPGDEPVESYGARAIRLWQQGVYPHGPSHDCLTCADGRALLGRRPLIPLFARRSIP